MLHSSAFLKDESHVSPVVGLAVDNHEVSQLDTVEVVVYLGWTHPQPSTTETPEAPSSGFRHAPAGMVPGLT